MSSTGQSSMPSCAFRHTFKHAEHLCCSQQSHVVLSCYSRLQGASQTSAQHGVIAEITQAWCNRQSSLLSDSTCEITGPCSKLTQHVSHITPLQHSSAATAVFTPHCSWKSTFAALLRQAVKRGGCKMTLTPALGRGSPAYKALHMLL